MRKKTEIKLERYGVRKSGDEKKNEIKKGYMFTFTRRVSQITPHTVSYLWGEINYSFIRPDVSFVYILQNSENQTTSNFFFNTVRPL